MFYFLEVYRYGKDGGILVSLTALLPSEFLSSHLVKTRVAKKFEDLPLTIEVSDKTEISLEIYWFF